MTTRAAAENIGVARTAKRDAADAMTIYIMGNAAYAPRLNSAALRCWASDGNEADDLAAR